MQFDYYIDYIVLLIYKTNSKYLGFCVKWKLKPNTIICRYYKFIYLHFSLVNAANSIDPYCCLMVQRYPVVIFCFDHCTIFFPDSECFNDVVISS